MDKIDLLYQKYAEEMGSIITDPLLSEEEFKTRFIPELNEMRLIELNTSDIGEGFLY